MPVISARGLAKAYGPQTLFTGLALTVRSGEKVGLLGVNGAGKSTLLRVLAGIEPADEGVVDRRRDASILYLSQEPELDPELTPRALVAAVPVGRIGAPEDIWLAVKFVLECDYFNGRTIDVDGGLSM